MRKRSAKFALLATAFLSLAFGPHPKTGEASSESSVPKLPQPSGPFGVGRVPFDWIDPNRPPDMAEDRGPRSELMVYVWYPIEAPRKEVKGTLFPGAPQLDSSVSLGLKGKIFGGNWPLVASGAITSHAQENAPIAKSPRTFPVVLFSPGAYGSCFQYSSAIEDLVSHGYVVAAIEHTSEVFGVVFPDGKTHSYSETRIPKESVPPPGATKEEYQGYLEAWYRHNVDVRAADISFVLDKLIELNKTRDRPSQFWQRLDLAHVAAVGHSRGGWSAIVSCRRDERIRACVNEDGNAGGQGLQYPGAPTPKQPILYVEIFPVLKPGTTPNEWVVLKQLHLTADEWVQRWHENVNKEFRSFPAGGYFVELKVPDMEHYSFSDEVLLRAEKDGSKDKVELALHGLRLTEGVTLAFLDEVLKNEKQTALRDSSAMTVRHFGSEN